MRFAVGQAFERVADKRQAVVTQIRDEGHAGLLNNSQQWLPIGMKEAAS